MVRHPARLATRRPLQAPPLTPDAVRLLLSPEGRAAVDVAATLDLRPAAHLATAEALRRLVGAALAPLALDQARWRSRARAKHPAGDRLWWTGEAVEQASAHDVATHRASRFRTRPVDLCCSVGGDLLPLAARHPGAVGVDLDEARLLLARANAEVLGLQVALARADVTRLRLAGATVFVDPARRRAGRRTFDPRAYSPPLHEVLGWPTAGVGVKVAPGLDLAALQGDVEVEVVSSGGEVKEAVLWGGACRSGVDRRATVLDGAGTAAVLDGRGAGPPRVAPPGAFLLEPDGAVLRAGLVAELAEDLGGWLLDPTIAYVAADAPRPTAFGRWYAVHEVLPFQLKRLRTRLRELDAGTLVVKKRGTAVEPEELRARLRLTGSRETTIVLTRVAGQQSVLVVSPVEPGGTGASAPADAAQQAADGVPGGPSDAAEG